jgi:hypothetical protein
MASKIPKEKFNKGNERYIQGHKSPKKEIREKHQRMKLTPRIRDWKNQFCGIGYTT